MVAVAPIAVLQIAAVAQIIEIVAIDSDTVPPYRAGETSICAVSCTPQRVKAALSR